MFDLLMALPQQSTSHSTNSGKPLSLGTADMPAQTPFSQVLKQRYVGAPVDSNQPAPAALLPTPVAEEVAAVLSQAKSMPAQTTEQLATDTDNPLAVSTAAEQLADDQDYVELNNALTQTMQPTEPANATQTSSGNAQIHSLMPQSTTSPEAESLPAPTVNVSSQANRNGSESAPTVLQEVAKPVQPLPSGLADKTAQLMAQELTKAVQTAQPQHPQPLPSGLVEKTAQLVAQELAKTVQPMQSAQTLHPQLLPAELADKAAQLVAQELAKTAQSAQPTQPQYAQPLPSGLAEKTAQQVAQQVAQALAKAEQPVQAAQSQQTQPLPQALVKAAQPMQQDMFKQTHQPAAMLARIESALAQTARLNDVPAAPTTIATMPREIQAADTTWVRPLAQTLSATAEPVISATAVQQAPQTSFSIAEASVIPATNATTEVNIAPQQTVSAAPTPTTTLSAPLATPAWQAQLSQQVSEQAQQIVHMRLQNDQTIRLRLHPAELGPLMISMKVEDQSAQIQFVSGHSQVRLAVEQALPQLRDILAEQGLDLGESSVRDHGADAQSHGQGQNKPQGHGSESERLADNTEKSETILNKNLTVGPGRVNVFA